MLILLNSKQNTANLRSFVILYFIFPYLRSNTYNTINLFVNNKIAGPEAKGSNYQSNIYVHS